MKIRAAGVRMKDEEPQACEPTGERMKDEGKMDMMGARQQAILGSLQPTTDH